MKRRQSWQKWALNHSWVLLKASINLIAFFSNCSKSHILKKLLVWVSTKVDHLSRLSTRRQTKILSVESAIRFFNFIVSIFEVESSSTMFLASLFSLRRRRVSSSSNWAIDWSRRVEYPSSGRILDPKSAGSDWKIFGKVSSRIEKLNPSTRVGLRSLTR